MPKKLGRIVYWSGTIEPHREGISKELFMLHRSIGSSFVMGTSPDGKLRYCGEERYFGFPAALLPSVRYWARFVESRFVLSHIFQGINNYHYLKALLWKPIILTAVSVDGVLSMDHYKRVAKVVVECNRDKETLIRAGFDAERLAVIYPGTTLPSGDTPPPSSKRFRILFASSPFTADYMESRGVRTLLKAAKQRPEVEFVLLWRARGDALPLLREWIKELDVRNATVVAGDIGDMNEMYLGCHAAVLPFRTERFTKSAPNSAVESLACGRPVLVSSKVGIADLVRDEHCGIVFDPEDDGLVDAVDTLRCHYESYRRNAYKCARRFFSRHNFLQSYHAIYSDLGCL